ncbi:MAG: hypothetical protein WAM14_05390 [Candidatus Nitrosopolaris sp.]
MNLFYRYVLKENHDFELSLLLDNCFLSKFIYFEDVKIVANVLDELFLITLFHTSNFIILSNYYAVTLQASKKLASIANEPSESLKARYILFIHAVADRA